MKPAYVLTRKQSEIVRSLSDDIDISPAHIASENKLTPSETNRELDYLEKQGIVVVSQLPGGATKIRLSDTGTKIQRGLTKGNEAGLPRVFVIDYDSGTKLKDAGTEYIAQLQGESSIDAELDRIIKKL